jgi:hypothetical protein
MQNGGQAWRWRPPACMRWQVERKGPAAAKWEVRNMSAAELADSNRGGRSAVA